MNLVLALLPVTAALTAQAAFHPVLVQLPGEARPELLGAWTGSGWLDAPRAAPQLRGGEVYRPLPPSGPGMPVKGGRAVSFGAPCEQSFEVPLTPAPRSNTFRLFTDGKLNALPRPVQSLPTDNAVYREIVRAELVRRGLKTPRVNLLGLTRVDLDGDGRTEVIVEAAHYAERNGLFPPPVGQPGDYSLLLLREVVGGQVKTTVLGAHVAPLHPWKPGGQEPMPMALMYRLAGVADLNGDGRMELVTFGAYYEGYGMGVLERTPGGWKTRVEGGCGV